MKIVQTASILLGLSLTLSGCMSFEGYIGLNSKGDVELAEASTGSPYLGWEAYVDETEKELPLLDESGALSGLTETRVGTGFDFFVYESNSIFTENILNKATLFNEAECSFGASEDLYIHFCNDEDIENANIFNGAILEGEWIESYQPEVLYGQTVNVPVYSIEGALSGLALEFYMNYKALSEGQYDLGEEFREKMNAPYFSEDGEEIIPNYIQEPVGTLTIFFNSPDSEILQAQGESVVDFGSDFFTIDLNSYDVDETISLSVIVSDVSTAKVATGNSATLATSPGQSNNWTLALISISALSLIVAVILVRRRKINS